MPRGRKKIRKNGGEGGSKSKTSRKSPPLGKKSGPGRKNGERGGEGNWRGEEQAGGSEQLFLQQCPAEDQGKDGGNHIRDGLGGQDAAVARHPDSHHQYHQKDDTLTADGQKEGAQRLAGGLEDDGNQEDDAHEDHGDNLPPQHDGSVADNLLVIHKAPHEDGRQNEEGGCQNQSDSADETDGKGEQFPQALFVHGAEAVAEKGLSAKARPVRISSAIMLTFRTIPMAAIFSFP